jgi:hypothetical protein
MYYYYGDNRDPEVIVEDGGEGMSDLLWRKTEDVVQK